jgi:hypothetical protein
MGYQIKFKSRMKLNLIFHMWNGFTQVIKKIKPNFINIDINK